MDESKNFEGDEMSTADLKLCQKITKHFLTLNSPRTTFLHAIKVSQFFSSSFVAWYTTAIRYDFYGSKYKGLVPNLVFPAILNVRKYFQKLSYNKQASQQLVQSIFDLRETGEDN